MKKFVLLLLVLVFTVLGSITAFAGVEPSPFIIFVPPPVIIIQVGP